MKLRFALSGTPPSQQLDRMGRNLAKAVTIAVTAAAEGTKIDLRKQLIAGGSQKMAKLSGAIRSKVFPNPPRYSPQAAAEVYAQGKEAERYFSAFSKGPLILPNKTNALAIPLHNYRDLNGRLLGPQSSFFAGRLTFIPIKKRGSVRGVLAMKGAGRASQIRRQRNAKTRRPFRDLAGETEVVVFLLVSSARLPRLLTPEATARKWAAEIPALIERALVQLEPS